VAAAQAGGDAILTTFGRDDVRLDERLLTVNAHGERVDVRLSASR
jgi:hypothetical protein